MKLTQLVEEKDLEDKSDSLPKENKSDKTRVVILNASLNKESSKSNTWHLADYLIKEMKKIDKNVDAEICMLSQLKLEVGLAEKVDVKDDGSKLYKLIKDADVVIMATPVWWGQPSSLVQRVIERMDGFDEVYIHEGQSQIYGKVFGVLVTGSDDGGQQCISRLLHWSSFLGFTNPPENSAFWVGEIGIGGTYKNALKNKTTTYAVRQMAANILGFAKIFKTTDVKIGVLGKREYSADLNDIIK